tara:strand:- start:200 stop:397 length:198 start_codon:yes stop_codon:yes gene_type:complete
MAEQEFNHEYDALTDYYKVTLKRDGFEATTWVSSMHLIDEKRGQLEAAIKRMAAESYRDDSASAA